jgi:transposase InsO family protein
MRSCRRQVVVAALGVDRLLPRWSVLDHLAVAHLRLAIDAEGGGNGPRGHAGLGPRRDNRAAFLAGQVASARARQEGRERRYAAAERLLAAPKMVLSLLIIPVLRPPIESDQYTSYEFGKALRASGLPASMGRVGPAFDNAMAEVFATLKTELIYRRSWPTRHGLDREVFSYLEGSTTPAAGTPGSATSAPATTRTSI